MDTINSRLQYLFKQYFNKQATAEELEELAVLAEAINDETTLVHLLHESWLTVDADNQVIPVENAEKIIQQIIKSRPPEKTEDALPQKHFMLWWRYAAAAILILAFSGVFYLTLVKKDTREDRTAERFKNDAPAGKTQATLTLSNGKKIVLDNLSEGTIAMEGNTKVLNQDGKISYSASDDNSTAGVNILTTARGQTFHSLQLADGTKVWLNAASSIQFPVTFSGSERKVAITGEVYFEVAKRPQQPFIVDANGTQIKVLGTHFNVNLYNDEPVFTTTLLEGAVEINHNGNRKTLEPGQQARLNRQGNLSVNQVTNIDQTIAWKNDLFSFESTDIETAMRQIARWYDFDVVYKGRISQKITGDIPRSVSAITIFKVLELAGNIHFTINGKKVEVMP